MQLIQEELTQERKRKSKERDFMRIIQTWTQYILRPS